MSQTLRDLVRGARESAVAAEAALAAGAAHIPPVAAPPALAVAPDAAAPAAAAPDAATPPAEGAKAAGGPVEPQFTVYKADTVSGIIYTFASAAGFADKDGDVIERETLKAMAHGFCAAKARAFNANHGQNHFDLSNAELVESIVGAPILKSGRTIKLGEELPPAATDPVIGMNIEKGSETHWLLAVRPNNPAVVEEAAKGGVIGASWEGFCKKVEA